MKTTQTIPLSFWRSRWAAYLLAVGLTALTLAVRVAIGSSFEGPTMIIFTIPVILSAYWGGIGPGLLSTVLSGFGAAYYILPPIYSFNISSTTERWQEVMLFLAGAIISFICERLHRSRRRAEKIIAELNRVEMASTRLAAIVESSTDAIISKDLNSIIITWNKGAEKIFGYAADEMVGTSIMRLIPADRQDEENHILGKIKSGESMDHFETLRQTKDGRLIHVSVTASPIKNADGKIIGVSKVARDITERKQMEEARRVSEARYRTLFDYAPDGIVVVDSKGYYLDVNASICRMLGYTRDEFIGLNATDIVAPAETPHIGQALDVIKNKSDYQREWQFRRKDGSIFAVDTIATAMPDGNLLAIIRDITERKRAEESLRLLVSAVEQSKESIVITDAELDLPGPKIIFINLAFTQMTGYTAEEVIGKTPRILQGPRTDKAVLGRLRQNLEHGESFAGEAINYRKDGTEFDLEWQIAPLRNIGGKITHFVATQHDVTERKKLEGQFRQSQKMEGIGQLASGVAHDFNNILAVIQMQSDLLKAEGGLTPAQFEFAEEIGASTQRAAALTKQLLLFSRKETLQPRDLDLNESINELTKMLRRILGEDIQLQFKFSMQPLFVNADAGMMDQVLMNLAVNSRDAMPKGGNLIIETSIAEFDESAASHSAQVRPGKFVCLSVSDTGCGIPPENLQRIFEPFFTTKDVGKGTGLGLATVFGIIQQHNGWVNVYSEFGHGTTFRIYLPRLAKTSDQKFVPPTTEPARGGDETIMLVEDEPRLRASVKNVLSRLGYNVLEASDGTSALEVWKKHNDQVHFAQKVWNQQRDGIHLLLTDMVMPGGMTGKDLAERLLKENPKLKVIYASGYSAEVAGKDFQLKEGVNFLTKPFQAQKLAQTIRSCLDKIRV